MGSIESFITPPSNLTRLRGGATTEEPPVNPDADIAKRLEVRKAQDAEGIASYASQKQSNELISAGNSTEDMPNNQFPLNEARKPEDTPITENLPADATPPPPTIQDVLSGIRPQQEYGANPELAKLNADLQRINSKSNANADTGLQYQPAPLPAGSCKDNADCNLVFGRGLNKCMNNKCECKVGIGEFCHKRPRYYKPLSQMTPEQVIQFKVKGNLEKMTIEDYVEWLSLWKFDVENLPKRHRPNFLKLQQGDVVYDIPMEDELEAFLVSPAANRDRVIIDIPNSDLDSPINWKVGRTLSNAGLVSSTGQATQSLNYSGYGEGNSSETPFGMSKDATVKQWFNNNINWLFYDIDRNKAFKNPNLNRFMNIVADARREPKPQLEAISLLDTGKKIETPRGSEQPSPQSEKNQPYPYMR